MKVLHFADLHFSERSAPLALKSLEAIRAYVSDPANKIQLVISAGDFFDGPPTATDAGSYPVMLGLVEAIRDKAAIFSVYGTASHDPPGCYVPLERLEAKNSWVTLKPNDRMLAQEGDERLLLMGSPEPRMGQLLRGGDASKEDLVEAMRAVFAGQGATRREHKGPCIYVWHGHLDGATLQNQTVLTGDIRVGHQDLELVGADYYALGDIHLGHQPFASLPAYYPGSAYPGNWGETDLKCFNVVDTETWEVQRVPYGHAPRAKVVWSPGAQLAAGLRGALVWLHLPEEKQMATAQAAVAEVGGVVRRITVEPARRTEVRVPEVARQATLLGKMQAVFPDAPKGAIEKCTYLELAAVREGVLSVKRRWQLAHVKLTGAIGLLEGSGIREYEHDFREWDGLAAIVGPTGCGKTTLVENLTPWPQMLTRPGALGHHFENGGQRKLILVDQESGTLYRFWLRMAGTTVERYIHTSSDGKTWKLIAEKSPAYEKELDLLFGSLDLYVRSVFTPQKYVGKYSSLTTCTQAERKAILVELCGLDRYTWLRDEAGRQEKATTAFVEANRDAVARLEDAVAQEKALRQARMKAGQDAAHWGSVLPELKKSWDNAIKVEREMAYKATRSSEARAAVAKLEGEQESARKRSEEERQKRKGLIAPTVSEQSLQADLDRITDLRQRIHEESLVVTAAAGDRERRLGEHAKARAALQVARAHKEKEIAAVQAEMARLRAESESVDQRVKLLARGVGEDADHCPECGQLWPDDKLAAARAKRDHLEQEIKALRDRLVAIATNHSAQQQALQGLQAQLSAIHVPDDLVIERPDERQLETWKVQLSQLPSAELTKRRLEEVRQRASKVAELDAQIAHYDAMVLDLRTRIGVEQAKIDSNAETFAVNAQEALNRSQASYQDALAALRSAEAQQERYSKDLKEQEAKIAAGREAKVTYDRARADREDWIYLVKQLGPDGLPAHEIEAKGPAIAEAANQILAAAYGDRFRVDFETQRQSADGKKLIEDFRIFITDTETGTRKLIEMLSGGEEAWALRAIHDAFADVRAHEGMAFSFGINDEVDGKLDVASRLAFLDMIAASHAQLGRRHTLLISHSREVQDRIERKIVLKERQE